MASSLLCAALLALAIGGSAALRAKPATEAKPAKAVAATQAKVAVKAAAKAVTAADVQALHKRLESMATGLEGMLSKTGSLSQTKVAPTLALFLKQLKATLSATAGMKDYAQAMKRLRDARAGVTSLTRDLVHQQESLMKEDESQKESLLLGVLMTRQKAPMDQQLEVLKSSDFAELPVSKALVAKHDGKVALYAQAAEFLDKHGDQGKAAAGMVNTVKEQRAEKVNAVATQLEKHLKVLEHQQHERERRHKKEMAALDEQRKKASKSEQHKIDLVKKRSERKFKKSNAMNLRDISSMKAAVDAVKKGDMAALNKARSALEASLKAMKGQTGGFLHLLQLGHKVLRRDCPFCAAQCLDKCHEAGKSYATCLTTCADAGKS